MLPRHILRSILQKRTLMPGGAGFWTKEYSVFLGKTTASAALRGPNRQAPENKTSLSDTNSAKLIIASSFNMHANL